jgi:hypothetical protein
MSNESTQAIRIDSGLLYDKLTQVGATYMTRSVAKLELYRGERPIFDLFGIEEEIARALGYPVYFVAMARLARGRYALRLSLLAERGNGLEVPKETTRRYALALERWIREHPADWFWSHNRWKLRKPLYAR